MAESVEELKNLIKGFDINEIISLVHKREKSKNQQINSQPTIDNKTAAAHSNPLQPVHTNPQVQSLQSTIIQNSPEINKNDPEINNNPSDIKTNPHLSTESPLEDLVYTIPKHIKDVIIDNPKLRHFIVTDPEGFKTRLNEIQELKEVFQGNDVDSIVRWIIDRDKKMKELIEVLDANPKLAGILKDDLETLKKKMSGSEKLKEVFKGFSVEEVREEYIKGKK